MTNNYSSNLDFIAHAGRGHDDNPPGRGSGRYAWGSGAKWGKAVNRVKGFFKKKKPDENRVETSQSKREVNTNANPLNKLSDDERNRLGEYLKDKNPNQEGLYDLINKAYGQHYSMSDMNVSLQNAKKDINSFANNNPTTKREVKTEKSPEQHEADRKAALESGNRKQILKYFSESSNEELTRAINKAGLMDSLNKSISDSKSKTISPEETAKRQKEAYIQEALWSGDYAKIMSVASDKSINNKDLENALDKARITKQVNRQLNPTALDKVDRVFNAMNKGLSYYNTAAPVWNIVAGVYNGGPSVKSGQSKALPMLPIPKQPQQPQQQKQPQPQH